MNLTGGEREDIASNGYELLRTLEIKVSQRIFRTPTDPVFWKEDSPGLQRLFVGFVKIFSGRTVRSLKSSHLLAYPVPEGLLNFSKRQRKRQIEYGHIVAFIPIETRNCEGMRGIDIWRGSKISIWLLPAPRVGC